MFLNTSSDRLRSAGERNAPMDGSRAEVWKLPVRRIHGHPNNYWEIGIWLGPQSSEESTSYLPPSTHARPPTRVSCNLAAKSDILRPFTPMRLWAIRARLTGALKSPWRSAAQASSLWCASRVQLQTAATPRKRNWPKEPGRATVPVAPTRRIPPFRLPANLAHIVVRGPRAGPVEGSWSVCCTGLGGLQICKGLRRHGTVDE